MRVVFVCPAPRGSRLGNRVTALRWKALLTELGHQARITTGIPRGGYDVLVALHARRSAEAVAWSRATHPTRPIVVALTGTDLYRDIDDDDDAKRSLRLADRLVVLHERAPEAVPRGLRGKVRVIRQSSDGARGARTRKKKKKKEEKSPREAFEVAFVAHLRAEKDPLRVAAAARLLPAASRVQVRHAGRALTPQMQRAARRETRVNPRYEWLGEVAPARARRLIARAEVMVLTSVIEGGANVLCEAVVLGTPSIASRIPAAVAALGAGYPGFFPVGDTRALARLLARAERDGAFLSELARHTRARRPLFARSVEKAAWRALLAELRVGKLETRR